MTLELSSLNYGIPAVKNKNCKCVKPPIGIIPEIFFEAKRIQELCRVISDYVSAGIQTPYIDIWQEELVRRIENYQNLVMIKELKGK